MTKYEFLGKLDQLLQGLEEKERKEILEDYEEHFAFARRAEKSDAEVIVMVGTPEDIAADILDTKEQHADKEPTVSKEEEIKRKEEELRIKAQQLEEQAKALEEKLAAQADALAKQAEALSKQSENNDSIFGGQFSNIMDAVSTTVGSVAQSVAGAINETFEMDADGMPENATTSESAIEQIIDMTGIKKIVIKARNQRIDIKKTNQTEGRVHLQRGMLSVIEDGDTLFIESRALKRKLSVGNIFLFEQQSANLLVALPGLNYEQISATTSNGKIEIEQFQVEQLNLESCNGKLVANHITGTDMRLKTVNGKVELAHILGNVNAQSTNGKVICSHIDGNVFATSTNGKLQLEHITGNIDSKTTNGKIEFKNETVDQQVKLQTTNAKIEVDLHKRPTNATIELKTSNAKPHLFGTERNYDVFGEGAHKVWLQTSNAKIDVRVLGEEV